MFLFVGKLGFAERVPLPTTAVLNWQPVIFASPSVLNRDRPRKTTQPDIGFFTTVAGIGAEPDDMLRQNIPAVTPIFSSVSQHRFASVVIFIMHHRVRLAEKPPQRIILSPPLEITLLALELQHLANLLKRQVEAALAKRPQLLADIGGWRLGGERQREMNG